MDKKPAMTGNIPPLTYGVWIEGRGWLRDDNGHYFADPRIPYAKTALRMWMFGNDGKARIELIDDSMIGLQNIFIERERLHEAHNELSAKMSFRQRLRRWINGLLG
jgi:hypothetical protein